MFAQLGNPFLATGSYWFPSVVFWFSGALSLFFIILIIYVSLKSKDLDEKINASFDNHFIKPSLKSRTNERWEKIKQLFRSGDPASWRIAIIEADSMLEQMLITLGYEGSSVAERLKKVEPSDFPTLQYAWEAHKVRNKIAHEGMNYRVGPEDAARVMRLYEFVFQDASVI